MTTTAAGPTSGTWQAFADAAGVELRSAQVDRIAGMETLMWLRVNPEALVLAREIKAHGVRTAILSNIPHDLLAEVGKFRWLDEFEVKDVVMRAGHREARPCHLPRLS